jgi:hypothetical protein
VGRDGYNVAYDIIEEIFDWSLRHHKSHAYIKNIFEKLDINSRKEMGK